MATTFSEFKTFEYNPTIGHVPVEQMYVEFVHRGKSYSVPLHECTYLDGKTVRRPGDYKIFDEEFQKGTLSYLGEKLPKKSSVASQTKYRFHAPKNNDTLESVPLFDENTVKNSKTVRVKPTVLTYGKRRSISMSPIDADFVSLRVPAGTVVDQTEIDRMRNRIPFPDKYLSVILEGDQNPQFIKMSEVYVSFTTDGINWSDGEALDLTGPKAAYLFAQLANGQARLQYRNRVVKEVDSQANTMTEYVSDSVVREERIDYDKNVHEVIDPTKVGDEQVISSNPIDKTYTSAKPGVIEVPDPANPGKTKKEHVYNVQTYMTNNKSGEYIRVNLLGEKKPTFVKLDQLRLKNGTDYTPVEITANVHDSLLACMGHEVFVEIDNEVKALEPWTQEQTVTYDQLKTYQKTDAQMGDDTYLLLNNGQYIKETTAIQPIAYSFKPANGTVDAYLVERNGVAYVIDKDTYNKSKTAPSIKAIGPDGKEMVIPIDSNTSIRELMRARDIRNCDVIQSTSSRRGIENATVLDKTNDETLNQQIETARQAFLTSYKEGKYVLDEVFTEDGKLEKIDKTKGERYVYSGTRTVHSYGDDLAEYQHFQSDPLKITMKNGKFLKPKGGPKFDLAGANAAGFKAYGKALVAGLGFAVSPWGWLSIMAFPAIVGVAAAAAVAVPIGILGVNAIRAIKCNRKNYTYKDKFLVQRKAMKKEALNSLEDLYKQCVELNDEHNNKPIAKYMKEFEGIYANIAALGPADNGVEIKINADGSIECTSDNAHLLSKFKKKYLKEFKKTNKLVEKKKKLEEKLKKLKEKASKYTKRALVGSVPQPLQDEIDAVTNELNAINTQVSVAENELKAGYAHLAQETYPGEKSQEELFKTAEQYKLISVIKLASKEELMELGLTAEQVTMLKNCQFNTKHMTIAHQNFTIEDILSGNMPDKLKPEERAMFNKLQNAFGVLSKAEIIASNKSCVQAETRNINDTMEVTTEVYTMDETLTDLEVTSKRVEECGAELDRLTTKYRDLTRLQELEQITSTFAPKTKKVAELKLIKEMNDLRKKYATNKSTTPLDARIEELKNKIESLEIDIARLDEAKDKITEQRDDLGRRKAELDSRLETREQEATDCKSFKDKLQQLKHDYFDIDRQIAAAATSADKATLTANKKNILAEINATVDAISIFNYLYGEIERMYKANDEAYIRVQNIEITLGDASNLSKAMADSLTSEKKDLKRSIRSNEAAITRYQKVVESMLAATDLATLKDIVARNNKSLKKNPDFAPVKTKIDGDKLGKKGDPTQVVIGELDDKMHDLKVDNNRESEASKEYEAKYHFFNEQILKIEMTIANLKVELTDANSELMQIVGVASVGGKLDATQIKTARDLLKGMRAELVDARLDLDKIEEELKKRKVAFETFAASGKISASEKKSIDKKYESLFNKITKLRKQSKEIENKIDERSRELGHGFSKTELLEEVKNLSMLYAAIKGAFASGGDWTSIVKMPNIQALADKVSITKARVLFDKNNNIKVSGIDPKLLKEMIEMYNKFIEEKANVAAAGAGTATP